MKFNKEMKAYLAATYVKGDILQLIEMKNENLPFGLKGKVTRVDQQGNIHMQWENGSTKFLCIDTDKFIKIEGE